MGAESTLHVPTTEEIEATMHANNQEEKVNIFGDGRHTTPTKWWAALGGWGVWIPRWPGSEPRELSHFGGAIGQAGSSTRQEITAWMFSLSQPIASMYATDSASTLSKAKEMLKAACIREEWDGKEETPQRNPFRRPWGLQKDGGLWEQAWHAIAIRGSKNTRPQESQRPCYQGRY